MNFNKQLFTIKLFNRLFSKGYTLQEILNFMMQIDPKQSHKMTLLLDSGVSLSQLFKKCHYQSFVYETLAIGEESNKTNEAMELVEKEFSFFLKMKNQFNKVLLYPLLLFVFSLICFELIRLNLYPILSGILNEFSVKQNKILLFFTFHLLKLIGGCVLLLGGLFKYLPQTSHLISNIKTYRSLFISRNLVVLLRCGYSLDESFTILKKQLNPKIYSIETLQRLILNDEFPKRLSPYTNSFLYNLKLGLSSNDLLQSLIDYQDLYYELLIDQLNKVTYYIQVILFAILSINIFLMYYLIMMPMLNMTNVF